VGNVDSVAVTVWLIWLIWVHMYGFCIFSWVFLVVTDSEGMVKWYSFSLVVSFYDPDSFVFYISLISLSVLKPLNAKSGSLVDISYNAFLRYITNLFC
jgi:hypothetical protein